MIQKVCNVLSTIILIVLLLLAAALFVPKFMGMSEYAVLTGSMEPTIPVGSLVYDQEFQESELKVGDVVTYQISEGTLVTHRVVEINEEDRTVITQGDANNAEDANPVSYDNIVGVCAFHLPALGYISIYIRTGIGIGIICGVIVVILLLNYLPELFSKDTKKVSTEKEKEI